MGSRFRGGREEFLQARFAELFAGRVHRFQDSVGVKENAVTCAERDFDGSIRSIWKKAEDQAVRFHFAALGVAPGALSEARSSGGWPAPAYRKTSFSRSTKT